MPHTIVILNLICISALFWLFDIQYRQYRIDLLRSQLFRLRDDLFDAADRGVIAFDDPAYTMTRQMMNGMIRFAHEVGLWRALVMYGLRKYIDREGKVEALDARYNAVRDALLPEAREVVDKAMREAHVRVLSHVLHTSVISFPLVIVAKHILIPAIRAQISLNKWFERVFPATVRKEFDQEAYLAGEAC